MSQRVGGVDGERVAAERRRILVVDDEPGMRYAARRVLERRFDVSEAADGEEALRMLENETFHLALIDVRLPGISGLNLLTAIKTISPKIDVIVMTGSAADPDEALEDAVRREAFFFLRKPFPMSVLDMLARRAAEAQLLAERNAAYVAALEDNLESARVFQSRLLPPRAWQTPRAQLAAVYVPAERLSGDFFDYWPLPSGGAAIFIADVMGHGASAAMLTGIVKSQLRSLSSEIQDPGGVLEALEEELTRVGLGQFLTAFLVFDRPSEGEVVYAGAGHPPAFALRPGESMTPLTSLGIPINTGLPVTPRESCGIARVPGTRLALYTDGYPETVDPRGVPFDDSAEDHPVGDVTPFHQAVARALAADTPDAAAQLLEAARSGFAGGHHGEDDRAAVFAWLL